MAVVATNLKVYVTSHVLCSVLYIHFFVRKTQQDRLGDRVKEKIKERGRKRKRSWKKKRNKKRERSQDKVPSRVVIVYDDVVEIRDAASIIDWSPVILQHPQQPPTQPYSYPLNPFLPFFSPNSQFGCIYWFSDISPIIDQM